MAIDGRVALVAGASRGIGADIARHLARAGAKVAVAARTETQQDPRLPGTIHSVAQDITSAGGTALPVVLNMRDPESIEAAVQRVVGEWGRVDILVNNAAIFVPGDLYAVQPRHINVAWEVNVRGYILTMKACAPHMKAAGGGRIINLSSRGAIPPGPGPYGEVTQPADIFYGSEKSYIEHFSQEMGRLLQRDGISVNVLAPQGGVRTPGLLFFQNDPQNPITEFESADNMGKAAVWICEQPPTALNGSILYDGDVVREHGL
ncbi:MAG: SDR family NAD(P)-dependent oxidoreductase [Chloroflexi bacterium]|nr:SDR family NAD(P)-dependent oxidoreductase [Chloroflexota bacterium]